MYPTHHFRQELARARYADMLREARITKIDAALEAGLDPLLWSRWGKDWRKFTTPGRIAARATRAVSAGDVILLHDADFYSARDSHLRTEKALPAIINELKRLGLDTVLPV